MAKKRKISKEQGTSDVGGGTRLLHDGNLLPYMVASVSVRKCSTKFIPDGRPVFFFGPGIEGRKLIISKVSGPKEQSASVERREGMLYAQSGTGRTDRTLALS